MACLISASGMLVLVNPWAGSTPLQPRNAMSALSWLRSERSHGRDEGMLQRSQGATGDNDRDPGKRLEEKRDVEPIRDHDHTDKVGRQRLCKLGRGAPDIDDDGVSAPDHGCGSDADGHLLGMVGRTGLLEGDSTPPVRAATAPPRIRVSACRSSRCLRSSRMVTSETPSRSLRSAMLTCPAISTERLIASRLRVALRATGRFGSASA